MVLPGTLFDVVDARSQQLFDQFVAHTLPKAEWTHQAHLVVCWVALADRSVDQAIDFLRDGISSYNVATGVENTSTSGYHETLTCYFVSAVASVDATTIEQVTNAPSCRVDAPAEHWSRARLFTPTARANWVEPDLAPLPTSILSATGW